MHVSLTPALEAMVREKVDSGLYRNASEVVRESLRLLAERDRENQWLQREAAIGLAQLKAGAVQRVTSKGELLAVAKGKK